MEKINIAALTEGTKDQAISVALEKINEIIDVLNLPKETT